MKNNIFKISFIVFILLFTFMFSACKKEEKIEYEDVIYLDREENIVYQSQIEKGKKLDENPFVEKEEGTYYIWDFESTKQEYNLDEVNDTVWIYGDLEYVDVEYKLYYNDELVHEEKLKYNLDYTFYPELPEYGVKKDERAVTFTPSSSHD